jgi:hypothetical protein
LFVTEFDGSGAITFSTAAGLALSVSGSGGRCGGGWQHLGNGDVGGCECGSGEDRAKRGAGAVGLRQSTPDWCIVVA